MQIFDSAVPDQRKPRPRIPVSKIAAWFIFLAPCLSAALPAQNGSPLPGAQQDLTATSIEDLMNIQVTSVSKTEQKLSQTAAAIFVISQEDIRRSGATNIPDLLRMVPGVDVGQINSTAWGISVRGLNGKYNSNLMVLLDGRPVYTPSFGGVNWDVLDLPLEDIERIEVIRGPGGSVWGANAVNGVINIITTVAGSHGGMIVLGGGNTEQGLATLQYGGGLGHNTNYRVFTKYINPSGLPGVNGQSGEDNWQMLRGGFRTDTTLSTKDTLTTEGDLYDAREDQFEAVLAAVTAPAPIQVQERLDVTGGYLQAAWNHVFSGRSDLSLSGSYDQYIRPDILGDHRKNWNLNFQHHFLRARQEIVWGGNYRFSEGKTAGSLFISFNPADLNTNLYGAFVEDKVAVVVDRLYLIAGTKLEHNYYTAYGFMPTGRLLWTPNRRHTAWAAVSQALNTPDENDAAIRLNYGGFTPPDGTPVLFSTFGNPHLADTRLVAYEAGYRGSLGKAFSIDLAAYFDRYSWMETDELGTPFLESTPAPLHLVVPVVYGNLMYGESHGIELFGNWKIRERWTLRPGYAFEQIHMHLNPGSGDTTSVGTAEGSSPVHSAQLRSHVTLTNRLGWDTAAYFVDRLTYLDVPSYTRVDSQLSWQWSERLGASVAGQNLLQSRHLEFVDVLGSTASNLMERGVYAKLTWLF